MRKRDVLVTVLAGAAGVAATVLIAGAALTLAPRQAAATPQYATQTGQPCGACHVSPGGGGKLTARGENFKKNKK
jgi:cytochrome c553